MKKRIGKTLEHLGVKKSALRLYFFFLNKMNALIHWYRVNAISLLSRSRSRNGIYAVDLDSDWLGLGARIVKTLEILLYCDERGLLPLIKYSYRAKEKHSPDYFGDLFYYKIQGTGFMPEVNYTRIRDIDELGWPSNYNLKLRINSAKSLFDKYLGINPDILAEVDLFVQDRFGRKKILGIHYRGTDKAGEAELLTKADLLKHIRHSLNTNKTLELIFISSDDEEIIQFLHHSDISVPVIFRADAVRSKDGGQFHRKREISKLTVNRDAIVNMLILARCDYLLKTASILSDCSVVFNPAIEVKVISFPRSENLTWWPAIEINSKQ